MKKGLKILGVVAGAICISGIVYTIVDNCLSKKKDNEIDEDAFDDWEDDVDDDWQECFDCE